MFQTIPEENIKRNVINGTPCSACNGSHISIQLGTAGALSFYITDKNDIHRLKELCEFALTPCSVDISTPAFITYKTSIIGMLFIYYNVNICMHFRWKEVENIIIEQYKVNDVILVVEYIANKLHLEKRNNG